MNPSESKEQSQKDFIISVEYVLRELDDELISVEEGYDKLIAIFEEHQPRPKKE